jgi:hypothetical protein
MAALKGARPGITPEKLIAEAVFHGKPEKAEIATEVLRIPARIEATKAATRKLRGFKRFWVGFRNLALRPALTVAAHAHGIPIRF